MNTLAAFILDRLTRLRHGVTLAALRLTTKGVGYHRGPEQSTETAEVSPPGCVPSQSIGPTAATTPRRPHD